MGVTVSLQQFGGPFPPRKKLVTFQQSLNILFFYKKLWFLKKYFFKFYFKKITSIGKFFESEKHFPWRKISDDDFILYCAQLRQRNVCVSQWNLQINHGVNPYAASSCITTGYYVLNHR